MPSKQLRRNDEYQALIRDYGNPTYCDGVFHIFKDGEMSFTVFDTQNLYTVIRKLRIDKTAPDAADYINFYENPGEIGDPDDVRIVKCGNFDLNLEYDYDELFVSSDGYKLYRRWQTVTNIWFYLVDKESDVQ
jgi:hypothetical protein